nr:MAG TPA_asm: hypothetical protein [Caudoviricetes sp.]
MRGCKLCYTIVFRQGLTDGRLCPLVPIVAMSSGI